MPHSDWILFCIDWIIFCCLDKFAFCNKMPIIKKRTCALTQCRFKVRTIEVSGHFVRVYNTYIRSQRTFCKVHKPLLLKWRNVDLNDDENSAGGSRGIEQDKKVKINEAPEWKENQYFYVFCSDKWFDWYTDMDVAKLIFFLVDFADCFVWKKISP